MTHPQGSRLTRERERAALAEQSRYSQEADARESELGEQRREWKARHPGAREAHRVAEREHGLAEQAHQAAEQRYEIADRRAGLAISFPARLVPGRAEPHQLTPGRFTPTPAQLERYLGLGPERHGPTIER